MGTTTLNSYLLSYHGGYVIFGSNLKGKVVSGGNITHDSITITNVEHVSGLAFNLISVGSIHSSNRGRLLKEASQSFPEPKSSSSVEDDRINEPRFQDLNGSPLLQVNRSDEGYPKSLKEARDHPIKHVLCELNERTLRAFLKLCIVEDPIWDKISYKLEEILRNTHVDECVYCQVQHMTKENVHALRKEMREIHVSINNDLKVLTAVIEDIPRVFLQDPNGERIEKKQST
ncbi:hypothetical protein Tco_1090372 [Tanacetum coccineum]|uniref:Uncharacterized protein n=1 Tax=Tanacetum coccineum TaxID=301880 RepID=A0ABQ5I3Z7_9ASTR